MYKVLGRRKERILLPIVSNTLSDTDRRAPTSLRYSPISACLNTVMPVGSSLRASAVDRAVIPKP